MSVFGQSQISMNNASKQKPVDSAKAKKSHDLPESLLNLEIQSEILGTGIDFSGVGVKAMIGSKNTGLLLGYTHGSDGVSYVTYNSTKLGYQYGIVRGLYLNTNFNFVSTSREDLVYDYYGNLLGSTISKDRSIRVNLGVGYTFTFGKKKRLYYNLETSFAVINTKDLADRLCINSGLGFRLGTPAKTSYEGVKNVTTVPMK